MVSANTVAPVKLFTIEAQSKGVLLVYYARSYDDEPIPNDGKDLKIENKSGIVENYEITSTNCYGVKYYIIETGTYTMTAQNATCGVYGFVYMPGNVATYFVKGDARLMGQYSKDDYSNLMIPTKKNWHFSGWYKDEANTIKVKEVGAITEPAIVYAHWTRCIWDFEDCSKLGEIRNVYDYDGILIKGSENDAHISTNANNLVFYSTGTTENNCVVFTPEYDGEMTVTYSSTLTGQQRICAIGTDVVNNTNNPSVIASGVSNSSTEWKTLQAKMKAGVTYYIYPIGGGIQIDKIQYQASAASAVVEGDNVTLTTTANMQGWRPFYDADNSYTVDNNTNVFLVVEKEDEEDAVKLSNRTGKKVPKGCPVILHSDAVQEDGTFLITMTKDTTPYEYEENDNLLNASVSGTPVNAYRLGYRAGEGNGIAFYPWTADTPSAGIVYLDLSNSNTAKIALEIEESATEIVSVRNNHNEGSYIFNINGQRLNAVPQHGVYIQNGRKVIK